MHLIEHILGLKSATDQFYLFWSGFGSDLGEFAIVGALVRLIIQHKQHNASVHNHITQEFANLTPKKSNKVQG